jgi:guanylate kinase
MSSALVLVISAPSGAGKSTLCRALLEQWPKLRYSVSCTTRPPRHTEVNGRDYVFIPEAEFQERAARGEFLEWARVHDHLYGTPKAPLQAFLREGFDVVLDVDPQGALSVKENFPESVCVYICPPTWGSLERRLRRRAEDDETSIAKRLSNARKEMSYLRHYDYLVVNRELKEAVGDLSAILRAEHRHVSRLEDELHQLEIFEEEKA